MITNNKALRLGFIGGALDSAVGYTHLCAIRLDGEFKLESGCFSRDSISNSKTSSHYQVAPERTYESWKNMIDHERDNIDALAVLTPIPSHMDIVCEALRAGVPVISEKTLALSSSECEEILLVLEKTQGYLAVTFNYSGYPMIRELRQLIRDGDIGELKHIQVEMPQESYLRENASPQDWRLRDYDIPTVSLDLGAHVFHLIDFLTDGRRVQSVSGRQSSHGQFPQLVDTMSCMADYEGDLSINAWWSKASLGYRNGLQIRIFGSKGSAHWLQSNPEHLHLADSRGNTRQVDRGCDGTKLAHLPRYNRFKVGHPAGFVEAFANLYADIACSIRSYAVGEPESSDFVFGAEHSIRCLRFLEAASASARSKNWESIPN